VLVSTDRCCLALLLLLLLSPLGCGLHPSAAAGPAAYAAEGWSTTAGPAAAAAGVHIRTLMKMNLQ
jgi:hypothetical protein